MEGVKSFLTNRKQQVFLVLEVPVDRHRRQPRGYTDGAQAEAIQPFSRKFVESALQNHTSCVHVYIVNIDAFRAQARVQPTFVFPRSEERRVGKECRSRLSS